jgi:single-strand DNA-binding protein
MTMNSCILMAEIISAPQLRYTKEDQTPVTEMIVKFEGSQPNDPSGTLRVVGWGNLASEIQQKYHQGDVVIIEGRLSMNTIEIKDIKEKRAELVASRIHPVNKNNLHSASSSPSVEIASTDTFVGSSYPKSVSEEEEYNYSQPEVTIATHKTEKKTEKKKVPITTSPEPVEQDLDEIPF